MSEVLYRKLDAVFRASTDRYEIYIGARTRHDGQTTQATAEDVLAWAAGLSDAHFEGSFPSAAAPRPPAAPAVATPPTPARTSDRVAYLRPIERDVLDLFRTKNVTRIPTQEIFERGPNSNADYVRAFEVLEKQARYLVRYTAGGTDWLELTLDGANALGDGQLASRVATDSDRLVLDVP